MVTGTPCLQMWFRAVPLAWRSVMHGDWNPLSSGRALPLAGRSVKRGDWNPLSSGRALPLTGRSVMHGDWNPLLSGVIQSSSFGREVSHAW